MNRRDFLKAAGVAAVSLATGGVTLAKHAVAQEPLLLCATGFTPDGKVSMTREIGWWDQRPGDIVQLSWPGCQDDIRHYQVTDLPFFNDNGVEAVPCDLLADAPF